MLATNSPTFRLTNYITWFHCHRVNNLVLCSGVAVKRGVALDTPCIHIFFLENNQIWRLLSPFPPRLPRSATAIRSLPILALLQTWNCLSTWVFSFRKHSELDDLPNCATKIRAQQAKCPVISSYHSLRFLHSLSLTHTHTPPERTPHRPGYFSLSNVGATSMR